MDHHEWERDMELFVEEHGSRKNPSIVLLHGGGLGGRMWEPQVRRLKDKYHCVVPDLPQQGRSAHIAPFSLADAAERVARLIQQCCQGRAHLVGLSLGGAVALTVMLQSPEVVGRVVVSGTSARLGRMLGQLSKWSARLYRYMKPETLVKASIKQFGIPSQYAGIFRDELRHGVSESFVLAYTDSLMQMRLPTSADIPLLVAVGQRETWVAKQSARKIVAAVPHAQGVIAPHAGHVWNLEY